MAAAVSIAFGAYKVFGVSMALGAFFAGMVVKESDSATVQRNAPLREIFSILFFVSVGMLFESHDLSAAALACPGRGGNYYGGQDQSQRWHWYCFSVIPLTPL